MEGARVSTHEPAEKKAWGDDCEDCYCEQTLATRTARNTERKRARAKREKTPESRNRGKKTATMLAKRKETTRERRMPTTDCATKTRTEEAVEEPIGSCCCHRRCGNLLPAAKAVQRGPPGDWEPSEWRRGA